MRFSTIASVVALFGAAAMASPNPKVVYETQLVTITSCGPEHPDCPGNTAHPTYVPSSVASVPAYSAPVDHPVETPVETPVDHPVETPAGYPSYSALHPIETSIYSAPAPPHPSGTAVYVPSSTGGYHHVPANTSVAVPSSYVPPVQADSGASIKGFSFIAAMVAAGAVFLA